MQAAQATLRQSVEDIEFFPESEMQAAQATLRQSSCMCFRSLRSADASRTGYAEAKSA